MEPRLLGLASVLLLSGCWKYLEEGVYDSVDGDYLPGDYGLYNQRPFFLLEEVPTWFRVAVLHSSKNQVGLAFLQYRYDYYSYNEWFDYRRLDEEGEPPNFVLCERRQEQFVCLAQQDGQAILGRVNDYDDFTLFGSGSESPEGTVINDLMISFTHGFQRLENISGGQDIWGDEIFTQKDLEQLQQDFDDWMDR